MKASWAVAFCSPCPHTRCELTRHVITALRLRLPILVLVPAYKRCEDADGGKGRARDERGMETCEERVLEIADAAGGKVLSL